MNKNKKTIKLITISLIIITLLSVGYTVIRAATSYNNDKWHAIVGVETNASGNVVETTYDFKEDENIEEVKVIQYGNGSEAIAHKDGQASILHQPNVWCAEKGTNIGLNTVYTYKVGQEVTVSDPELAYILNAGPEMDGNLEEDYRGPHQLALWRYLNDSTSDDKNTIVDGLDGSKYEYTTEDMNNDNRLPDDSTKKAQYIADANKILADASNYANRLALFQAGVGIKGTPTVDYGDGTTAPIVSFEVEGTYDALDVLILKADGSSLRVAEKKTCEEVKNDAAEIIGHKISIELENADYSEDGKLRIAVKAKMTKYEATYRVLKRTANDEQRLLVTTSRETELEESDSTPVEVEISTDVSLQKYIIKVNENKENEIVVNPTRENKKTATTETELRVKDEISKDNTATTDEYKASTPVKIEAGDDVTYRIHVYNNSTSVNAIDVEVRDILPFYTVDGAIGLAVKEDNIKIVDKNGTALEDDTWEIVTDSTTGYKELKWNTGTLPAGESTYYDITVTFDKYINGVIENTAWISSSQPNNTENYRTVDRDYVKMKEYSVSLEKFITKVTDSNGDKAIDITERDGKRYNENSTTEENKNTYKLDNKVNVEPGDLVTYTVRLKNTHEDTSVRITEIYDIFHNEEDVKLIYVGPQTIKGTRNSEYKVLAAGAESQNPALLAPGEYEDFTVVFKVDIASNNTGESQELRNKAGIVSLKNRHNINVPDSDGDDNNHDEDWVKTKIYAVSLEKFVSSVNGHNVNPNREGRAEWKGTTYKYDAPVTVSKGNIVTYTIQVKNDGETTIYITEVKDTLPDGVKYIATEGAMAQVTEGSNDIIFTNIQGEKLLEPGESAAFTVKVEVLEENTSLEVLKNTAEITKLKNRNNVEGIVDSTLDNNKDSDYINLNYEEPPVVEEFTTYSVEKIWVDENNKAGRRPTEVQIKLYRIGDTSFQEIIKLNEGNSWKHTWSDLKKYDNAGEEYKYDVEEINVPDYYETVPNKVSDHKKIIRNYYEGTTPTPEKIDITVQKYWHGDTLEIRPSQIQVQLYKDGRSEGGLVTVTAENGWKHTWTELDGPVDRYEVKEIRPDNYAVEYDGFSIHNTYTPPEGPVIPSTIGGYVWNDKALDKNLVNYDGKFDREKEDSLEGIKVSLYREGEGIIAETVTSRNGAYGFNDLSLSTNRNLDHPEEETDSEKISERYIKGPRNMVWDETAGKYVPGTFRGYYSYYVIFEYDGVTYTSSPYVDFSNEEALNSNAEEDRNLTVDGIKDKLTARTTFNSRFNTINNDSEINYETVNEEGKIPQSRHISSGDKFKMQSSTSKIDMETATETSLDHVNLGLRGRDILDLEITSDVETIEVDINGKKGVYEYTNKVTVRRDDLSSNYEYAEDMANPYSEGHSYIGESQEQRLRGSDYGSLREIKVIYKITVKNTSSTIATATKITNYFGDYDKYEYVGAYANKDDVSANTNSLGVDRKGYNTVYKYGYVTINTGWDKITKGNSESLYVVYRLKDPSTTLSGTENYATLNMAEIAEYRSNFSDQNEYTRGLIDKDSAPGSADKERVRLASGTDNKTTVKYYFTGENLANLKYEDDTYATPTLYFVKEGSRKITGIVYEDLTVTDSGTRIKTGNAKLDDGEVGIAGVKVELINVADGSIYKTIETAADELGRFTFKDVLPGNYKIKYTYGHNEGTTLKGRFAFRVEEGKEIVINKESYNGEDYQATNNSNRIEGMDTNVLDTSVAKYWYVFNEDKRISTAKDDLDRRDEVSKNVVDGFRANQLAVFNIMRDSAGKSIEEIEAGIAEIQKDIPEGANKLTLGDIIDQTNMYAYTPEIEVTVEETVDLDKLQLPAGLREEVIRETDSTHKLGQWCIFPSEETDYYKDYIISEMNFGIAQVPVTTVGLEKYISKFTITDSTGSNVISQLVNEDGVWIYKDGEVRDETTKGVVQYTPAGERTPETIKTDVEDDKLQGARLEVEYTITKETFIEKNFDGAAIEASANITGLVDLVDNKFSYNESLGNNQHYWDVVKYADFATEVNELKDLYPEEVWNNNKKGVHVTEEEFNYDTQNAGETDYTTILKLKDDSRFFQITEGREAVTLTLERVLSSTETLNGLLDDVVDVSSYENKVQITGFEYTTNTEDSDPTIEGIDRIRTTEGFIILPGLKYGNDIASAEVLKILPPTGDSSISIIYYVVAIVGLAVLVVGVFGIKKFVIKK